MGEAADKSAAQNPAKTKKDESLVSWIFSLGKNSVKSLPQTAISLAVQFGIIFLVNLVFWWEPITSHIPNFILTPVVFLTATRNGILAKSVYWIIIFSFGKKLVLRMKKHGIKTTVRPITRLVPELKDAFALLLARAVPIILSSAGIGLAAANYFSSYGLTGEKVNKIDKYFVSLLISFTVSYLLGEGRRHWIFKFGRLAASDTARVLGRESGYTDSHTYVLMSGFVLGLLANAPFALISTRFGGIKYIGGTFRDNTFIGYLGYYIGAALLVAGIVLFIITLVTKKKKA